MLHDLGAERPAAKKRDDRIDRIVATLDAKAAEFLNVPKPHGQFLNLMVKATRARRVLEIGTAHGYCTIWMALGLEETGGRLVTLEILPERVDLAKKHVAEAGLSPRVTFKRGNAHELVSALGGMFDFVLVDADKDGVMDYFEKLYPKKLESGALLLVHGAIQLRDQMNDYLEMIARHPDFDTVILTARMDEGFAASYRKRV